MLDKNSCRSYFVHETITIVKLSINTVVKKFIKAECYIYIIMQDMVRGMKVHNKNIFKNKRL